MAVLHPASPEQLNAVKILSEADRPSLIITAVAGAGKTTTILHMIKELKLSTLVITYSKHLRKETKTRLADLISNSPDLLGIPCEVHTFHSLSGTYFPHETNVDFDNMIQNPPLRRLKLRKQPHHNLVIIDEMQDMSPDLFHFVDYFLSKYLIQPQLVLIGDTKQCIFQFKGSDPRFLTLAPLILPKFNFRKTELRDSFRITPAMATFVNHLVNADPRATPYITSAKTLDTSKIDYINCENIFNPQATKDYFNHCLKLIAQYGPENTFVLGYSIKQKTSTMSAKPIHRFENFIVNKGIKVFIPSTENEELTDDLIEGKLIFSTFHQAKGRERDLVILFDFSNFYHNVKRTPPDDPSWISINEEWYVALTRAKKKLVIFTSLYKDSVISFFNLPPPPSCLSLLGAPLNKIDINEITPKPRSYSVTTLVEYIPPYIYQQLKPLVDELFKSSPLYHSSEKVKKIEVPSVLPKRGLIQETNEEVADLNALAIIGKYTDILYENHPASLPQLIKLFQKDSTNRELNRSISLSPIQSDIPYLLELTSSELKEKPISEYLKLANCLKIYTDRYSFRLHQIKDYHWFETKLATQALINLHETRTPASLVESIEYELPTFLFSPSSGFIGPTTDITHIVDVVEIYGRLDLIERLGEETHIIEYKCVKQINYDHLIQLSLYAWICTTLPDVCKPPSLKNIKSFRIINIMDGLTYLLNPNQEKLTEIAKILIKHKIESNPQVPDEEFINRAKFVEYKPALPPLIIPTIDTPPCHL